MPPFIATLTRWLEVRETHRSFRVILTLSIQLHNLFGARLPSFEVDLASTWLHNLVEARLASLGVNLTPWSSRNSLSVVWGCLWCVDLTPWLASYSVVRGQLDFVHLTPRHSSHIVVQEVVATSNRRNLTYYIFRVKLSPHSFRYHGEI